MSQLTTRQRSTSQSSLKRRDSPSKRLNTTKTQSRRTRPSQEFSRIWASISRGQDASRKLWTTIKRRSSLTRPTLLSYTTRESCTTSAVSTQKPLISLSRASRITRRMSMLILPLAMRLSDRMSRRKRCKFTRI